MNRWMVIVLLALPLHGQERYQERVEVRRIILDAYITDFRGNPIEGLTPADFEVRLGGKQVEIDSVDWIPVERELPDEMGGLPVVVREGRLIILFFQTDFARNQSRVRGQMQIIPQAIRFLDTLTPSDLVAIVQFDSHLRIRADFTNDRKVLESLVKRSLMIDRTDPVPPSDYPSILRHLDPEEARDVANPEAALLEIGRALNEIPGAKSLVMFGYGLGVFGDGGVTMRSEYDLARLMLERSRTTVFSLDITEADYHSLEVGLQTVARDTGGFYVRTHLFPAMAISRLTNTLRGRYEITLKPSGIPAGRHEVDVRVERRDVYVQVPHSIMIGS